MTSPLPCHVLLNLGAMARSAASPDPRTPTCLPLPLLTAKTPDSPPARLLVTASSRYEIWGASVGPAGSPGRRPAPGCGECRLCETPLWGILSTKVGRRVDVHYNPACYAAASFLGLWLRTEETEQRSRLPQAALLPPGLQGAVSAEPDQSSLVSSKQNIAFASAA